MTEQQGLPGIDTSRTLANPNDCWMTPDWLAEEFVAWSGIGDRDVLEPSSGTGQLLKYIRPSMRKRAVLTAFEIDPAWAEKTGSTCADFLVVPPPDVPMPFGVTVSNPPFSLMLEFIERALLWTPRVCMILPASVHFGKNEHDPAASRHRLWTEVAHIERERVISARPRFIGAKDTSPATDFIFAEIRPGGTPRGEERALVRSYW